MTTHILADGYWFQPETAPYTIIAHPLFWVLFLAVWYVMFVYGMEKTPKVYKKFNPNVNRPGDFTKDGNPKDSGAENRVRKEMKLAGYSLMDQSTALVVGSKYGEQGDKPRKITPDIIVYALHGKPMKMIVEYDGASFHGGRGGGAPIDYAKICDDAERNQRYAELGYKVVRVRAGDQFFYPEHDLEGNRKENMYARITKENDVVLPEDYVAEKHRTEVMRTIRNAKYFPPRYWDKLVEALHPYVEAEKQQRQIQRNMQGGHLH